MTAWLFVTKVDEKYYACRKVGESPAPPQAPGEKLIFVVGAAGLPWELNSILYEKAMQEIQDRNLDPENIINFSSLGD